MKVSLAQFSQVVALIHEAGAAPERWTDALAAIVGLVQGSRIALMDIDAGSDALLRLAHVGHDPAHSKAYSEYYFAIDPTRAAALSAPALKAITMYEEFPKAVRARHEYFDFARRFCEIGDVVGISTPEARGQRSLLSLQRPLDAPCYDRDEKMLIGLLAPHVALAKRVQTQLGDAWSARSELEAAFGKLEMAAFIVDSGARVRHLNAAATSLMARCPTIALRCGKLTFTNPKLNAAVLAALRSAARELGRSAALPIPLGDKDTGEILITPLEPGHGLVANWEIPLALVMVATAARDEKSIAWRMRQLHRLTPAESRIAALLALGRTVEEIAGVTRVSDATLRSHLRSIFSKTGTRRQAELVNLALRGTGLKQDL